MGILRAHQVKHICKSLKPRGLCLKDRKQKAGVAFSFGALIFLQQLKEGEHRDVLLPGGEDTVASTRCYRSTLSSEQGPHGPPSDQRCPPHGFCLSLLLQTLKIQHSEAAGPAWGGLCLWEAAGPTFFIATSRMCQLEPTCQGNLETRQAMSKRRGIISTNAFL